LVRDKKVGKEKGKEKSKKKRPFRAEAVVDSKKRQVGRERTGSGKRRLNLATTGTPLRRDK